MRSFLFPVKENLYILKEILGIFNLNNNFRFGDYKKIIIIAFCANIKQLRYALFAALL